MAARRPQLHHLHTRFIALIIFSQIGLWLNLEYLSRTTSFPLLSLRFFDLYLELLLKLFVSRLYYLKATFASGLLDLNVFVAQQNYLSTFGYVLPLVFCVHSSSIRVLCIKL